ncbi:TetR/AcrR family transcriptional regulator [Nocardia sp. NPDC052254]|uniref:TetR/AcrR family transcriptional regulator n=1 Tax=Nocardia sp. NPDC052254 TaxID=3155681 RepID=UPI00341F4C45
MPQRRRGAELEHALLDAAWAELTERGYAGFTIDKVAERAHTSRQVIYRRWPDRHALLRATFAHAVERHKAPLPDTGTLRGDVLLMMRAANSLAGEVATLLGAHLAGYFHETGTGPADLGLTLGPGATKGIDIAIARAAERGEVDPRRITERMKSLPFDLLQHEYMMTFRPVADHDVEEILDTLFLPLVQP